MWKARLTSLSIALLYVAATVRLELDPMDHRGYFTLLFVALCLIWFPEQLGSVRGIGVGGSTGIAGVDQETPGCVVAACGWLLLVGLPLAWLAMRDVAVT